MNRLDKFRQERYFKRKCRMMVLLFLLLVVAGIGISDYSVNSLMNGRKAIEVVSFERKDSSYLALNFAGYRFYINTGHINRDINKFKNQAAKILGLG